MAAPIVDPTLFHAEGATVNWDAAARRLGLPGPPGRAYGSVIALRWMLSATLGLPTEPFRIWTRPQALTPPWQELVVSGRPLAFADQVVMITWTGGAVARVRAQVQAPSGGTIAAFCGAPLPANICASVALAAGNSTVELAAPVIDGLLVPVGIRATGLLGIPPGALASAGDWTLLEIVGLPVDQAQWRRDRSAGRAAGTFRRADRPAVRRRGTARARRPAGRLGPAARRRLSGPAVVGPPSRPWFRR